MSSPSRPSPDPYPGLAGLPDGLMREVVDAVWFESGRMRASLHRLRRVRACDVVVRVAGCGSLFVGGECPCRDFVLDMLVEADRFLARHEPSGLRNPPGAVRAHVRRRAQEWTRRRRADAGAQARTDRLDASEQGRRLPDAYHRALLRNLADEAGSLALLGDERGLLQRLAALAANQFGGEGGSATSRSRSGAATGSTRSRWTSSTTSNPRCRTVDATSSCWGSWCGRFRGLDARGWQPGCMERSPNWCGCN